MTSQRTIIYAKWKQAKWKHRYKLLEDSIPFFMMAKVELRIQNDCVAFVFQWFPDPARLHRLHLGWSGEYQCFSTAAQKGLIVGTTAGSQLFQLVTAGPKVIQGRPRIDKTESVYTIGELVFSPTTRTARKRLRRSPLTTGFYSDRRSVFCL